MTRYSNYKQCVWEGIKNRDWWAILLGSSVLIKIYPQIIMILMHALSFLDLLMSLQWTNEWNNESIESNESNRMNRTNCTIQRHPMNTNTSSWNKISFILFFGRLFSYCRIQYCETHVDNSTANILSTTRKQLNYLPPGCSPNRGGTTVGILITNSSKER